MRALKTILIILLALGALLVVLGFMGPKTTVVERSAVIEASPEVIYPKIASLRTMHSWSPWREMELGQETTYTGTDGEIGAMQSWVGDTVGTGSLERHSQRMERSTLPSFGVKARRQTSKH